MDLGAGIELALGMEQELGIEAEGRYGPCGRYKGGKPGMGLMAQGEKELIRI